MSPAVLAREPYPRRLGYIAACCAAILVAACGGGTSVTNVVGPDVRCSTTLAADGTTVPADGGRVSIAVDAARECSWSATVDVSWVQLSATSGQGAASVQATASSNPQGLSRTATVRINSQPVSFTQEARPCRFDLSPTSAQVSGDGGSGTITVTTLVGCSWSARSDASWVRVAGTTRTGSGTVSFDVDANDGLPRDGAIQIADQSFTVTQGRRGSSPGQPGPGCTAVLRPGTMSVQSTGSNESVRVEIGPTCNWTAVSNVPWLTIVSGAAGQGTADVGFAVAPNTGAARTGTLTIAQQTLTVTQAAAAAPPAPACTFSLSSVNQNIPAAGGNGQFTVTTQAGCAWTASVAASWVTLGVNSGNGTGTVSYTVQPNTATTPRATTISVGGQLHSVEQWAAAPPPPPACTFSVSPPSQSIGASGGNGQFSVTTGATCAWNASSGAAWITLNNGAGTGNGNVTFTVQPNTATTPRSGAITVGGQTHTVDQAAAAPPPPPPPPACTFSVSPASQSIGASGGSGQFSVTTQQGCNWSATAGASWVTVSNPSGSGSATIQYSVQPNSATTTRSTTISVGGQTHTIDQAAAQPPPPPPPPPPCTFTISPSSQSFSAQGGNGNFNLTTQQNCQWNALSNSAWVTVTTPSGTGSGNVTYDVQANMTGMARSAVISVGGQSYTVDQAP